MLILALRESFVLPLLDWSCACLDALTLPLRAPAPAARDTRRAQTSPSD